MGQLKEIGLWDWEYVSNRLPSGEHDWIEYKCSSFEPTDLRRWDDISQYISAYANYDGGYLIFGVRELADKTHIPDDGVPFFHSKFKEVKSWIEDKFPQLIDPHSIQLNAQAIPRPDSPERGVIAVYISPSNLAPHQAQDMKFYGRQGSKLRALTVREIQDIAGRKVDPEIDATVSIFLVNEFEGMSRLTISVENRSDIFCNHHQIALRLPSVYDDLFLSFFEDGTLVECCGESFWVISVGADRKIFPREKFDYQIDFNARALGVDDDPHSIDKIEIKVYADSSLPKIHTFPARELIRGIFP